MKHLGLVALLIVMANVQAAETRNEEILLTVKNCYIDNDETNSFLGTTVTYTSGNNPLDTFDGQIPTSTYRTDSQPIQYANFKLPVSIVNGLKNKVVLVLNLSYRLSFYIDGVTTNDQKNCEITASLNGQVASVKRPHYELEAVYHFQSYRFFFEIDQ